MPTVRLDRRLSHIYLWIAPFLTFLLAVPRALRVPGVYHALAGLQAAAITAAAWKLGGWAIRGEAEERKRLALAGGLLVAPWAILSLLVGMGAPFQATEAENHIRYWVLLVAGILVAGGFVVLKEALREAGERFYSALGFAAIILAAPSTLIAATFPLTIGDVVYRARASSGQLPDWAAALNSQAVVVKSVALVPTYLAIAAFAAALRRTGWGGRTTSRVFVGISLFALPWILITTAVFLKLPDPRAVLGIPTAIPGFVFSIPAVPFMLPCLIGADCELLHQT